MPLYKVYKAKKKQNKRQKRLSKTFTLEHCKTIHNHKFLKLLNLKELNLDWSFWILHNCLKKKKLTYQTAIKSTTTSLAPALVISDWKCASFSITITFPVAAAILSEKELLYPRADWRQVHYHWGKTTGQLYCGTQRCWQKMSSSSVVPVVLWGSTPPSHCISCIITTYDQKTVVTGSTDGQLGIWDLRFADDGEIKVRLRGPGIYTGCNLIKLMFSQKKCQVVTLLI